VVPKNVRESIATIAGKKETAAPSSMTSARPAAFVSRRRRRCRAAIPSETTALAIVNQNAAPFATPSVSRKPSNAAAVPSDSASA
jgi:hypothetical protein